MWGRPGVSQACTHPQAVVCQSVQLQDPEKNNKEALKNKEGSEKRGLIILGSTLKVGIPGHYPRPESCPALWCWELPIHQ